MDLIVSQAGRSQSLGFEEPFMAIVRKDPGNLFFHFPGCSTGSQAG
eukprot:CAMPEP_0185771086 /NCGR_PEP_ID=MMETSP1174-20130828/63104_1 /TAXON_ID=35687 /ORGANISM="Dictyocha speculum, Strain CCMP1381" /LENGTH=45 /DNA_ID= /DNA_START= /DNA_END= /DNA_ORIENTATION=